MIMKNKLSLISSIHYFKLVFRSLLFIWALFVYILNSKFHGMSFTDGIKNFKLLFVVIWVVFASEMILRFFPSPTESMGCQKQFKKNYIPTDTKIADVKAGTKQAVMVAVSWIILNGLIGILYFKNLIDDGILLLICLFYAISDMICILFFCPFQALMMKNRCCTTCRVYNWDYLMMFSPLILIPNIYTYSLVGFALVLFLRWEITNYTTSYLFYEETNHALACENCKEKLCFHKKNLHYLWKVERKRLAKIATEKLKEKTKDLG